MRLNICGLQSPLADIDANKLFNESLGLRPARVSFRELPSQLFVSGSRHSLGEMDIEGWLLLTRMWQLHGASMVSSGMLDVNTTMNFSDN